MTFIWLIVWLVEGTPKVDFSGDFNNWAIALLVCALIDIASSMRRS